MLQQACRIWRASNAGNMSKLCRHTRVYTVQVRGVTVYTRTFLLCPNLLAQEWMLLNSFSLCFDIFWLYTKLCHVLFCSATLLCGFPFTDSAWLNTLQRLRMKSTERSWRTWLNKGLTSLIPLWDFSFLLHIAVEICGSQCWSRWKMLCCHGRIGLFLAGVWSSAVLRFFPTGGGTAVTSWSWSTAGVGVHPVSSEWTASLDQKIEIQYHESSVDWGLGI